MSVWLVTGGTGFLGRHLLGALADRETPGIEVVVLGRQAPPRGSSGAFVAADLDDPSGLGRTIAAIEPDVVFHLAGRTPPATPEAYYRGNTMATVHLLDALRARNQPARVILAGSAAELGPVTADRLPVAEDYRCRPSDSYGLSKWLATTAGLAARPPLEVVAARIFNPIGPGLATSQAFGRFAARLAEPGPDPLCLTVGDLEARRDFVDVRDVARALIALAGRGQAGSVYHVGTGQSRRVGEGLDHLVRLSGREVEIEVTVDVEPRIGAGVGPSDSRADIARIVAETGWRPLFGWTRSLDDLWAESVTKETAARGARGRS